LSPTQVKRDADEPAPFSFTCKQCFWHGNKNRELDVDMHGNLKERYRDFLIDRFPMRCRECEKKKKRFSRMVKRVDNIYFFSMGFLNSTYRMPKLITFALPSQESESYYDREVQIELLKKKLKSARSILLEKGGVLGGTYIIECTSRLLPFPEYPLFSWKHHAHVHMVGVAPFIPRKHLVEFCECLFPIGLGRINYKVPKNSRAIASYISKYLVKDKNNSRTFGIMRKSTQTKP